MTDLTTLTLVEQFLSPPLGSGNADEPVLAALITAASAFVVTYVGWPVLSGSFTETRNGTGGRVLSLKNRPVTAVSTLTIDGVSIPPSSGFGTAGYWVSDDGTMLLLRGHRFERGLGNVTIAYTAGYATVPADLQQAVNELVALRFKERKHFDQAGETINGAQGTTFIVKDMRESTRMVLDRYRRVAPGWP
jgi:hypothetical protein